MTFSYSIPPLASFFAGDTLLNKLPPFRWIITGERGAGKSHFCTRLVEYCELFCYEVGGVLSIAEFDSGQKTGILLKDIQSGETRLMAVKTPQENFTLEVGCWYFDPAVLLWGNQCLQAARGCDVVVLDECGILEFVEGDGFFEGLRLFDRGEFEVGFVVVRPELLSMARNRWPDSSIYRVEIEDHD